MDFSFYTYMSQFRLNFLLFVQKEAKLACSKSNIIVQIRVKSVQITPIQAMPTHII